MTKEKKNIVTKTLVAIAENFAKYNSVKSFPILTYEVKRPQSMVDEKM